MSLSKKKWDQKPIHFNELSADVLNQVEGVEDEAAEDDEEVEVEVGGPLDLAFSDLGNAENLLMYPLEILLSMANHSIGAEATQRCINRIFGEGSYSFDKNRGIVDAILRRKAKEGEGEGMEEEESGGEEEGEVEGEEEVVPTGVPKGPLYDFIQENEITNTTSSAEIVGMLRALKLSRMELTDILVKIADLSERVKSNPVIENLADAVNTRLEQGTVVKGAKGAVGAKGKGAFGSYQPQPIRGLSRRKNGGRGRGGRGGRINGSKKRVKIRGMSKKAGRGKRGHKKFDLKRDVSKLKSRLRIQKRKRGKSLKKLKKLTRNFGSFYGLQTPVRYGGVYPLTNTGGFGNPIVRENTNAMLPSLDITTSTFNKNW